MTEIIKNKLYLGSIDDANDLIFLNNNKIDTILSIAYDSYIIEPIKKIKTIHKFQIEDSFSEKIIDYFPTIIKLIEESNDIILVHCMAGVSRSATIIIAYLMSSCNMTLLEAYYYVKIKRPMIKPNHEFIKQLIKYEFELYNKNSVKNTVGFSLKK